MPVAQHDLRDHPGRDSRKHVIAVHAHPVVAARRTLQSVAVVIVDHILTITVIIRQAVSTMPVMRSFATRAARAAAPRTVVRVHWLRRTAIVVILRTGSALRAVVLILVLIATAVMALHGGATRAFLLSTLITRAAGAILGKRRGCQTQACKQYCNCNMTFLHEHLVQRCKYLASISHASRVPRSVAEFDILRNAYKPSQRSPLGTRGARQAAPLSIPLKRSMRRIPRWRRTAISGKALLHNALL